MYFSQPSAQEIHSWFSFLLCVYLNPLLKGFWSTFKRRKRRRKKLFLLSKLDFFWNIFYEWTCRIFLCDKIHQLYFLQFSATYKIKELRSSLMEKISQKRITIFWNYEKKNLWFCFDLGSKKCFKKVEKSMLSWVELLHQIFFFSWWVSNLKYTVW